MDHQQQNLVRTAINVCGHSYVHRWQRNFLFSELAMALIRRGGKFISVNESGNVFAGGSIRVLATNLDQMGFIKQPQVSGMSTLEGGRNLHLGKSV
jgi:hypothetical protein